MNGITETLSCSAEKILFWEIQFLEPEKETLTLSNLNLCATCHKMVLHSLQIKQNQIKGADKGAGNSKN